MSKKKKVIILSCMIALLAVTAIFNFVLSGNDNVLESSQTAYFSEYRSQLATSRNEMILALDKVISESEEGSEARENAILKKYMLTSLTETELKVESLIKAYGYEEIVVTMSLDSPNVNVVVKDADFTQDDAVKIYNIVSKECNTDCENINIIAYL